jgi:hypothetical protein
MFRYALLLILAGATGGGKVPLDFSPCNYLMSEMRFCLHAAVRPVRHLPILSA